jgi:hypothetical protein
MKYLRRDILINIFQGAEIKSIDTYIFMKDKNFILSEKSKKYFLSDYAKSIGEEYNDFNFTIVAGMYYEFKKKVFHMNFVLGSVGLSHEIRL